MKFIGRKILRSGRSSAKRIDALFLRISKVLIVGYAIFLTVVWISERGVFRLTEVAVVGTHAISAGDIEAILRSALDEKIALFIRRDNTLLYPQGPLLKEISEQFPRVKQVEMSYPDRHHVQVSLSEYTPALLYCLRDQTDEIHSHAPETPSLHLPDSSSTTPQEVILAMPPATLLSDCYYADLDGYVFSHAPEYSGYPFLVIIKEASSTSGLASTSPIGMHALNSNEYGQIQLFISALRKLSFETHTVIFRNEHDVVFETDMPWDIYWSTSEDPEESAKNLDVLLQSLPNGRTKTAGHLEKIDLRFGNKVFYH